MSKDAGGVLLRKGEEPEVFLFYDLDDADAWAQKYSKEYKCQAYSFRIHHSYDNSDNGD